MTASRRVRIADVAARASVGVGTVSRVLNGSPHVRERTRQRVLEAISQTGYRPSRLAAGLSRGTPGSVAIIAPFLTRPSVVARLAGVIEVLDDAGYDTIVCNVETAAQRDRQVRMFADGHRAAAAVIISLRLSAAQLADLAVAGMPVVAVDAAVRGVPHIVIDDARGGRLATAHLTALGHRRIGFIGDHTSTGDRTGDGLGAASTAGRLRGYRQALASAGIDTDPELIRRGPHGSASAERLALGLLRLPDPPTAIFAASDIQAMGVLSAAEAAGVPVPGRLSVIGFDDIEIAAPLGLSTVRQPLRESGARGARRLCALLGGGPAGTPREELPLEVVARRSTTALRSREQPPGRSPKIPAARAPRAGRGSSQDAEPTAEPHAENRRVKMPCP